MRMTTGTRNAGLASAAALIAAVAALTLSFGGFRLPLAPSEASDPPPSAPLGESFSVGDGDPLTATGVHPADILIAGPVVAIPCANLGLWCTDPGSGAKDDLIGLAYDYDFLSVDLPPIEFSVGPGSMGTATSAVRVEATCATAEPRADVFETSLAGANSQDLDGNGVACGSNAGLGLGLDETSPGLDNIDALARDPNQYVDLDRDTIPEAPVYMTLAPGSPSLAAFGATSRDILMTVGAADPVVWASGAALGLVAGDVVDAICVDDGGDGVYQPATDRVLFSLAPGSPTLTSLPASAADLLRAGPAVDYPAARLGLLATDNVDALKCPANDRDHDTFFDIADNCPDMNSFNQNDNDNDGLGDVCDSDDDNDGVADVDEGPCGANPLSGASRPERIDGVFAGADDDGDTAIDEALPGGAGNFDCDGDGYKGTAEDHVLTPSTQGDQDPCGSNVNPPTVPPSPLGWPADLIGGVFSGNKVNIQDISSYVAPVRYLNTNVGTHMGDVRWDIVPGSMFGPHINIQDLASISIVVPPMLGVRAFNGPVCPWP